MMSISPYHACTRCGRLIAEDDAHTHCQRCRSRWQHTHIVRLRRLFPRLRRVDPRLKPATWHREHMRRLRAAQ